MNNFKETNVKKRALMVTRILICTLLLGSLAFAHGGMEHILGTVTAITDHSLSVKTRDGAAKTVEFDGETKFVKGDAPATVKDVQVGSRVVDSCSQERQLAACRGSQDRRRRSARPALDLDMGDGRTPSIGIGRRAMTYKRALVLARAAVEQPDRLRHHLRHGQRPDPRPAAPSGAGGAGHTARGQFRLDEVRQQQRLRRISFRQRTPRRVHA